MNAWLCFLVAAVACANFAQADAAIPVTVYYESLCPDSIKFYVNQLFPLTRSSNLSTHMDLTLVPFGKSEFTKLENGSWSFKCHHGDRECYGNKVQVCAIEKLTSKNERLSYLNCLLKKMLPNRYIEYPTTECASEVNVDSKVILDCANSTMGDELLAREGNKTNAFMSPLKSVPTVVFNNTPDANDQNEAITNLQGTLCKYIPEPKPAECMGSGAASLSTSLFVILATISLFFSQHC